MTTARAVVGSFSNLPVAMRQLQQWLLWRFETVDGEDKPRKVPYWIGGKKRRGKQGGDQDRANLATFEAAVARLERGGFDGLGFAFLPGDGLIGVDIDGAIDPDTGEVSARCQAIIQACASYTELSPSGKGVHIIVRGHTKTFKDNSIGLEVFCESQFFTCTGSRWAGTPETVEPLEAGVLARLAATVRAARKKPPKPNQVSPSPAAPIAGRAQPTEGGDKQENDFRRVNDAALRQLDAWVPTVFPSAVRAEAGGYRVKSQDLGRELQEDISIHPDGIRDFGVGDMGDAQQGRRTAIDLVMEHMGGRPVDALKWLADRCGVELTKRKRSKAKPEPTEGGSTPSGGSAEDEESGAAPREHWRRQAIRTAEGGFRDCRENVCLLLMHHPKLKGLVAFDLFSHTVMKMRTTPWGSEAGEWGTTDDYELGWWLAQQERLVIKGEGTIVAGVAMAAHRAAFHPVRDYLATVKWDGIERLSYWLSECLGATESTYTKLVGRWFILGMVKRVLQPGCQMDHMIVLEGGQGKGKSTALRVLAGEWFADTPIKIGDKDALLNLAGVWLYEVAELDSFNKAEVTAVKQYVSSRVDRVREPYARRPANRQRSCVLGGTTNQHEYFKDPTGARRFWPVAVADDIRLDRLAEWRDQLFAEAVTAVANDERYYPTREEAKQYLEPEQEAREIGDPWLERAAVWLDAPEQLMKTKFTSAEILLGAMHVTPDRIDGGRQMATRVGVIMHKLGWEKRRDATGARIWRYYRPSKAAQQGEAA